MMPVRIENYDDMFAWYSFRFEDTARPDFSDLVMLLLCALRIHTAEHA